MYKRNNLISFSFLKDGQEIYASGRYQLVTDGDSNTVYFCVKKSKPNDEGRYKVVATNSIGSAEAETRATHVEGTFLVLAPL